VISYFATGSSRAALSRGAGDRIRRTLQPSLSCAYFFRTNVAFELGLLHHCEGCSRAPQRSKSVPNPEACPPDHECPGRASIASCCGTKDDNGRQFVDGLENVSEFSSAKRTGRDAINNRVVRDTFPCKTCTGCLPRNP